jgi:hypothetical protein
MTPEVTEALAKAQQKQQRIAPPSFGTHKKLPAGHAVHPKMAYLSGKSAKKQGFARVTPYYEAPKSDHFWFAGYDGKTMEEAIEGQ